MDKLLVASEYTDPAFHIKELKAKIREEHKADPNFGLLLITKDVKSIAPIMELTDILEIPTILHATITGLGGTIMERQVPNYVDSMKALSRLAPLLGEHQEIVLRVDPLIPDVTDFDVIEQVVARCQYLGITRCRTSVIDYYPFARKKMTDVGYATCSGFQAPQKLILAYLDRMDTICREHAMTMETCAEQYDEQRGCARRADWKKYGLAIPLSTTKQRGSCFCNTKKHDLLKGKSNIPCPHGCLYCYWGKYR